MITRLLFLDFPFLDLEGLITNCKRDHILGFDADELN